METRTTVFRPDGTVEERSFELAAEPGYDTLKSVLTPLLDGGRLEHVTVLHDGERADLFVDEDFHEKGLPRNEAATAIYRNNWLTQHPGTDPETLPPILGTAILFSRRVWF